MTAPHGVVTRGISTVQRYGFNPLLLSAGVAHRVRDRRSQRRLRDSYAIVVADPPGPVELRVPKVALPSVHELPHELRDAAERIRGEAEDVLAHRVDYLGSGPVELGPEIDWHLDFKSGYRWPLAFYQDLEVTRLDDSSDAKVPWELSRGHQLLTLARAARLYEDERYAVELESQLRSWIDENRPGYGINWVTPMEVALRAINWLWAIGTLEGWRPLDGELRRAVARSLQVHGRHIAVNLEGSPLLRANHYLADIVGLQVLARYLAEDPEARRWEQLSRRALEREILSQVHPDGVGFEASLPYHGLTLEMFLIAWHVAQSAGKPFSSRYRDRVARMLEVSGAVRHPDGRSPVFGDQDSGRVLPGGFARPASQDNLIDLGSALLEVPRRRSGSPDEEVAWILGLDAWRRVAEGPIALASPTAAFPAGGLYVLNGHKAHMVVRWGGVGQNGNGGHGHNDLSSFELSYGAPVVVDSGTYLYTADVEARDRFRSATAHNVLVVNGRDMHPLPALEPFRMPARARFAIEEWAQGERLITLTGWHDGYSDASGEVRARRRVVLDRDTDSVEVTDTAEGAGIHLVESLLHLSPQCAVRRGSGAQEMLVSYPGGRLRIGYSGPASLVLEDGWVSSQYGVRERAPVIRAAKRAELPVTISYRIEPA